MAKVVLKELKSWRDWLKLLPIKVKPEQRQFTTHLFVSYLQASHPAVTAYELSVEDNLIGYVMLIHADNPVQWIVERLTIDQQYQRQGYGYDVLDQLIDMIYEFDASETVVVRYNTNNEAARQLAIKLKFVEQDKLIKNRNIALLEFEFEETDDDEDDIKDDDDDEIEDDTDSHIEDDNDDTRTDEINDDSSSDTDD